MPTNQFPTFAAGGGANTISADMLNAKTTLMANGFPNGQPPLSVDFNSLQRRSLFVAAAIAKLMENSGVDALDNGDLSAFVSGLSAAIKYQSVPSGCIMMWGASTPPIGWVECDGSTQVIGGVSMATPDMRGEFPRGWDHGRGIDGGRAINSAQGSQNEAHTHGVEDTGHTHSLSNVANRSLSLDDQNLYVEYVNPSVNTIAKETARGFTGISISSSGGSESRPRNIAFMFIMKT